MRFNATDNFVSLIPSYVVFDNMLIELISALNITTQIVILYDNHYGMLK